MLSNFLIHFLISFLQYQEQHDWERVRREHTNVSRIVKQLKELLYQMDTLRAQVLDADIEQFDKLTANARTSIMNAIKEYLGNITDLDYIYLKIKSYVKELIYL